MATTIRNQKLFCLNCGGEFILTYPMEVDAMSKKMKSFDDLHKDCKPTWKEPEVDLTLTQQERADWWLKHGERGMSSEFIFNMLQNGIAERVSLPQDPDDFKRCYKLLKAIPEWRERLHELKNTSSQWSKLIDNWDNLTEMFEDMLVCKKDNGMYDFMNKILK